MGKEDLKKINKLELRFILMGVSSGRYSLDKAVEYIYSYIENNETKPARSGEKVKALSETSEMFNESFGSSW